MYYSPFDATELFNKHRDGCGDISNHIEIVDVEVTEVVDNGEGHPPTYICTIYMRWVESNDEVYEYPEAELEDPDDYDGAVAHVVSQVV